jgi:hypothetical protein
MAYVTLASVSTGDLLTATDWNQAGDNFDHLAALKAGGSALSAKSSAAELLATPRATYTLNESSNYTTTSTSFVDIDATKLALTLITNGGDVEVNFYGSFSIDGTQPFYLDVAVDGVRTAGDDGLLKHSITTSGATANTAFRRLISSLAAGSHTFKLQWKTAGNTLTLYAGAGTSQSDVHPQFWVKEIFNV